MKWTVEEAKKLAKQVGIDSSGIDENNLELYAKKIRKKLRQSGESITALRPQSKIEAKKAEERKSTRIAKSRLEYKGYLINKVAEDKFEISFKGVSIGFVSSMEDATDYIDNDIATSKFAGAEKPSYRVPEKAKKEAKEKPKLPKDVAEKVVMYANEVKNKLAPYAEKIEITGSIRRGKPEPNDVDIVAIPSDRKMMDQTFASLGDKIEWGPKKKEINYKGVKIDLYYAEDAYWGAMVLRFTGPKGVMIGLSKVAKEKGWTLSQYGVIDEKGNQLAGKTEQSVYEVLGEPYLPPHLRGQGLTKLIKKGKINPSELK